MITFARYSAERIGEDALALYAGGEHWFTLPLRSAVDADGVADRDEAVFMPEAIALPDSTRLVFRTKSNLWAEKAYIVDLKESGFTYHIRVRGRGKLDRIRFFSGDSGARYEASGYLLPIAAHADETRSLRMIHEEGAIGLGYFVPPLYAFPFYMSGCDTWFGLGLVAQAGQYNFDTFHYKPHGNRFHLELPLYGQTSVDGEWTSQGIWGAPGIDAYDVLRAYAAWHYDEGLCKRQHSPTPRWWLGPLFCGWGEQNTLAPHMGLTPFDTATQAIYETMSTRLDEVDLHPTMLIIDDKWQETYGGALPDLRKWPDLRAFVDSEHQKGRKVILWFKAWNNEGLMQDECATLLCSPCGADPTSPAYIARMQRALHTLLSSDAGCYDIDGFKIDFANCMPLGDLIRVHEPGVYGVELLKRLFLLIHNTAKAIKSDALINTSCCHPYFAEVTDQVRLHDYRGEIRSCLEVMRFRKDLIEAAMPGVPIDTDAGSTGSHRDFQRYMAAQPTLGAPDLYWLSASEDVPMDAADFALLRKTWQAYSEGLDAR